MAGNGPWFIAHGPWSVAHGPWAVALEPVLWAKQISIIIYIVVKMKAKMGFKNGHISNYRPFPKARI